MDLIDKRVVLTGGASGIGAAVLRRLANAGRALRTRRRSKPGCAVSADLGAIAAVRYPGRNP